VDVEARILRYGLDLLLLQTFDDIRLAVEQRKRPRRGVADKAVFDARNLRRAEKELRIRL
jgi:hypothetical protein